jgi:predicted nucleic acid-binding protein
MGKQIFMDTAFLIAVIDTSDKYHNTAKECYRKLIEGKWLVITTEAILVEIGNGLSKLQWRHIAHKWIRRIQRSKTIFKVIPISVNHL